MTCPHCKNGWIEHAPDPSRPDYRHVVHCTCVSPGNRLGIAAIDQQRTRQIQAQEWERKWIEAGKPSLAQIVGGVRFGRVRLKDMTQAERDEFMADFRERDKQAKARRLRGAAATQGLIERGVIVARQAAELETT